MATSGSFIVRFLCWPIAKFLLPFQTPFSLILFSSLLFFLSCSIRPVHSFLFFWVGSWVVHQTEDIDLSETSPWLSLSFHVSPFSPHPLYTTYFDCIRHTTVLPQFPLGPIPPLNGIQLKCGSSVSPVTSAFWYTRSPCCSRVLRSSYKAALVELTNFSFAPSEGHTL